MSKPQNPQLKPFDEYAEAAVLGSLLYSPEYLNDIPIEPGHFFVERYRWIFQAIQTVYNRGDHLDSGVSLPAIDLLVERGQYEYVRASTEIAELSQIVHISDIHHYTKKLRTLAEQRRLAEWIERITESLYSETFKNTDDITELFRQHSENFQTNGNGSPVFNFLSFDALMKLPDKEWLISDLLGKNDLAMIFAESESGKTFLSIDLLFSCLLGLKFADTFEVARPLTVCYACGEGGSGIKGRFAAAANHYSTIAKDKMHLLDNLQLSLLPPQLFADDLPATMDRFIRDYQGDNLDLLIVDTLHSATLGMDENSSRDTRPVLESCKRAIDKLGCTVLLIHHSNRQGKYRGSSSLHAAMDTMIAIENADDNGVKQFSVFKQKDAQKPPPLYFELTPDFHSQSVYCRWLDDYEPMEVNPKATKLKLAEQEIMAMFTSEDKLSQTEIIKRVTAAGRNTALQALKTLEDKGTIICETGLKNAKVWQLVLKNHENSESSSCQTNECDCPQILTFEDIEDII